MGVRNPNGILHYLYDANHATGVTGAQRIMKGSLRRNGAVLNGAGGENSYIADPYSRRDCEAKAKGRRAKLARPSHALRRDTIYVNPYYIVTHYSNYAEVTKHYYNGTARLAAQLEGDYDYLDQVQPLEGAFNPVEEDGKALLNDLNLVEGTDYSSAALYEVEATYPLVVMSQAEFNSAVTGLWGELPPASTMPCHISMYWPFANNGVNCNGAGVMYFYHPDYLGHTEYITDHNGAAYQYFHYSGFGEALVENKSNLGTHTDYFRFNGKELDPETGNYYYGARYYDPKVSVWLSVDPLATKYPHVSPYNFVENNPLRLIDPTGMGPEDPEKAKSTTENTVISGTVDENNTTHVNQTTINSKRRQLEDGTTVIDEKITEVTNEVRNSDGQVAKGKVNTFSRTGVIDAEGNLSYSPKVRAGTRDQKEGEFKDLDAWTGFISDYSAKNKENYNVQSFNKGGALTSLAGGVGTLPVTIFGGGTIPLSSAIKSVLGAFKVPLNVSSAATSAGGAGTYYLGSNSNYFQIYGVSQSYNGVRTKQMRQPQ